MLRRPALLLIASLLLVTMLGSSSVAAIGPDPGFSATMLDAPAVSGAAATPALPTCAYLDIKTRFRSLSDWRRTLVDTRLRVGSSYRPNDLVPVSQAGLAGGG